MSQRILKYSHLGLPKSRLWHHLSVLQGDLIWVKRKDLLSNISK